MRKLARFGLIGAMMFLSGCASYHSASLAALSPLLVTEYEEMEGLSIGGKAFSVEECITYLDRDLLKKGIQPIQLTFYNQTDKNYLFSTSQVGLACSTSEEVAKKVHTATVGRVVGYTAGALLSVALFIPPLLIVPAVVDGIRSSQANQKLDHDFSEKAADCFLIPPGTFKTTLLFVPKGKFSPVFDLTLIEEETGTPKTVKLMLK